MNAEAAVKMPQLFSVFFPRQLYAGYGAAFLGFQPPDFVSSDYFPLFPWLFLFMTGLFAAQLSRTPFAGCLPGSSAAFISGVPARRVIFLAQKGGVCYTECK